MRILISENKVEKLKNLIELKGMKKAVQLMGSFNNIVKVLGYEDVEKYIYQYLADTKYPDYGWQTHEDYKDEMGIYGLIQFFINDIEGYYINDRGTLDIKPWLWDELEELFDGYNWKRIFQQWFEDNTGLEVIRVD
jgi:hypothetical protein